MVLCRPTSTVWVTLFRSLFCAGALGSLPLGCYKWFLVQNGIVELMQIAPASNCWSVVVDLGCCFGM